jgi:glutathione synthase/RimK-type ligase-like ATP-grasp enzyme
MKKVLILFGKSNWQKSRPFDNKDYQYSYEYFYTLCKRNDIQMYRASYKWYDGEKNIFKYAWIYRKENAGWERVKNVKPDLIYDKTKARLEVYCAKEVIGKNYRFINDLEFTQLIDNKFLTSLLFEQWSKRSWLVNTKKELRSVLPKIKTSRVVLKPLMESGGKNVLILSKESAAQKIENDHLWLAQEFVDSSRGVPGFSKGVHDLRLVFVNEKIIYAYIREPAKGKLLANLAQGGSLTIVPIDKIPKSILPVVNRANQIFETFNPRVYSIDFMFDEKKKPWVVELNSMPGLYFTPDEKPYMMKMYQELLKVFSGKLGINKE